MENQFVERILKQLLKKFENRATEARLQKDLELFSHLEEQYARPDDVPLTPEQKEEVRRLWSKYSFAYPQINYNAFKVYMNRTGKFDPRYLPGGVRTLFLAPYLQNKNFIWPWNNKALLSRNLPKTRQPKMVIARMQGFFYDGSYNVVTGKRAVDIVMERFQMGVEQVFKISSSQGGMDVEFYGTDTTREQVVAWLRKTAGMTIVIQEAIKQHPQMALLNPSSLNTVRITSIIWDKDVRITGRCVKAGNPGKRVDNFHFGGHLLGVDKDGYLNRYALNMENEWVTTLPSGLKLDEGEPFRIPGWDKLTGLVKRAHRQLPYMKLISWDIGINEDGDPVLIELNFGGDPRLHQLSTGPVYEEYTEDILDKAILDNYYKQHSDFNFDYREYYDHVEIEKYVGTSTKVAVPETFKNKPVTKIRPRAFFGKPQLEEVVLGKHITAIMRLAFGNCAKLKSINLTDEMKVARSAFIGAAYKRKK